MMSSVNLGVVDEKGHEANGAVLTETTYTPPEPKEKPLGIGFFIPEAKNRNIIH